MSRYVSLEYVYCQHANNGRFKILRTLALQMFHEKGNSSVYLWDGYTQNVVVRISECKPLCIEEWLWLCASDSQWSGFRVVHLYVSFLWNGYLKNALREFLKKKVRSRWPHKANFLVWEGYISVMPSTNPFTSSTNCYAAGRGKGPQSRMRHGARRWCVQVCLFNVGQRRSQEGWCSEGSSADKDTGGRGRW